MSHRGYGSAMPVRPVLHNSVLRLRTAHPAPFTPSELLQNSHGVVRGKLQSTLSHIPSVYYYLSQCCGIGFAEADALVASKRLLFGAGMEPVTGVEQLKMQMPYSAVEDLDLRIVVPSTQLTTDNVGASKARARAVVAVSDSMAAVPVAQRRLHRTYCALFMRRGVRFTNDPAEPRSFTYRLPAELLSGAAAVKYNLLVGPGYNDAFMCGCAIATSDLAMVPHMAQREGGNYGVYRVWMAKGVPDGEVQSLAEAMNARLRDMAGVRAGGDDDGAGEDGDGVDNNSRVIDADVAKRTPRFAVASEGIFFPFRGRRKQLRSEGSASNKKGKSRPDMGAAAAEAIATNEFRLAKCIWVAAPYFPRAWQHELLMMGTRTAAVELVQVGSAVRFEQPELRWGPDVLSQSSRGQFPAPDVLATIIDAERASWRVFDDEMRRQLSPTSAAEDRRDVDDVAGPAKQQRRLPAPVAVSPRCFDPTSPRSHFNGDGSNAMWCEALAGPALDALFRFEKQIKINAIVRSLRDACEQ